MEMAACSFSSSTWHHHMTSKVASNDSSHKLVGHCLPCTGSKITAAMNVPGELNVLDLPNTPERIESQGYSQYVYFLTWRMSASSATLARSEVATKTEYRIISSGSALSSFLSLSLLLTNPCKQQSTVRHKDAAHGLQLYRHVQMRGSKEHGILP